MTAPRSTIAAHLRLAALLLTCLVPSAHAEPVDPGGGIGGTGITGVGAIQKFGSIFVNGREFFLDRATRITRDGEPTTEGALRLGDVVVVDGNVDPQAGRSLATRVDIRTALQGPIESIDPAAGTFVVSGQTVRLTPRTYGEQNATLPPGALRVGDVVRVSGFSRGTDAWTATRVAPVETAAAASFLVRGQLDDIDLTRRVVTVAGRRYSLPRQLPANVHIGDLLRLTGSTLPDAMLVQTVSTDRLLPRVTGRTVEMSGYVQSNLTPGTLVSNGTTVHFDRTTHFENGNDSELQRDAPMALRGEIRADGSVAVREMIVNRDPHDVVLPARPRAPARNRARQGSSNSSDQQTPAQNRNPASSTDTDSVQKDTGDQVTQPVVDRPRTDQPESDRPAAVEPVSAGNTEKPDGPVADKPESPVAVKPDSPPTDNPVATKPVSPTPPPVSPTPRPVSPTPRPVSPTARPEGSRTETERSDSEERSRTRR
jgi:hypothetical protein